LRPPHGHPHPHPQAYPPQQGASQPASQPRTVYMPPVAQMAPAPYPYAGGAAPDPRAVGPAWAAPAAQRPVPIPVRRAEPRPRARPEPSRPGFFRRLLSALFTIMSVLLLLTGAGFVVVAILNQQGIISLSEEDIPVVLPEQPIAIPAITPLIGKPDRQAETAWSSGTCGDYSNERDLPAYQVGKNSGSAQILRGRTAALVVKIFSPSMVWVKATETNVERAALMTQRFYLTQAKARNVPLTFDVIPWPLRTGYQMPALNLDANQRLSSATMDLIRDSSRLTIESALGAKLDRVVSQIRKDGYDNVAFFVFFPVKTTARNFAVPSYRSAPVDYPEAAYLFAPTTDFGHFAVTMAHEGMHLFGADDIYRIKSADKRDDDDVMGEYCTGFLKAKVGDATAFAVGWLPTPPPRAYGFEIK
jgi:hypothetical protein